MCALSDVEMSRLQSSSATLMEKAWAMVRLSRPHMFVAGALLYAIGVALASSTGVHVDLALAVVGLVAVFFGQISGQIANDYWDRVGDARSKRTFFSGGSGVLLKGLLTPETAFKGALFSCAIAVFLGFGIQLWFGTGILTVPIILIGTVGGWLYSAEPVRLVSTGLGEVIVTGVVSFSPIMAGFYMQTGTLSSGVLIACIMLAVFLFPVFLGVEFPDYYADKGSGKMNLLVRLGLRSTAKLYTMTMFLPYVVLLAFVLEELVGRSALIIFATLPFAVLGSKRALALSVSDLENAGFVTLTSMVVFVMTMALFLFSIAVD